MLKYNRSWIGLTLGLLAPIVFLLVLYIYMKPGNDYFSFLAYLFKVRLLGTYLKLGLLLNLALFMVGMQMDMMKFCKGILLATVLSGLLILYMYFF